jgi:hypothetical protein
MTQKETYEERRNRQERERQERERAREELQAKLPQVEIDNETWTSTSTEDNRRQKRYTRTLNVGVRVLVRDWQTIRRLDNSFGHGYLPEGQYPRSYWSYVHQAIEKAFAGAPWPCKVTHEGCGSTRTYGEDHDTGWDYYLSFYVSATYAVPKPSKIPSEEDLLAWLGGAEAIGAHLRAAILDGIRQAKEATQAIERARIANLILEDLVERVDEAAKREVRYAQRLAALNAEYEAEREVQCAKLLDELGEQYDTVWEDAPEFKPDARSFAAAKAKLPERAARLNAPADRGLSWPGRHSEVHDIKIGDV